VRAIGTKIEDKDYYYYYYYYHTDSEASTYKHASCVKTLRFQKNEDTPVKARSSSISDLHKIIVSPERTLVLPPVFDSDRYEMLSVRLETARLNGVCTIDLI
jgi:hypothetical protein